jgi:signal transduction histidine kinase
MKLLNEFSRLRFAIPVILGAALLVILVSELTYRETTATLRAGIRLTDARMATARVLQLLTDAETAQRGYLLTGKGNFLEPLTTARAELPAARQTLMQFLAATGPAGQPAVARLQNDIDTKLSELETTIALVGKGDRAAALGIVESGLGTSHMDDIRQTLAAHLAEGAAQQQQARVSLYDSLWINRAAVIALTLLGALGSIVYIRHMRLYEREQVERRRQLETEVARRTSELRELAGHLQTAREDEKATLARELHDELGGLLTAVKLDLARVRTRMVNDPAVLERLAQANQRLDAGIALKRRVIEDLRPSALINLGLTASLEILCGELGAALGVPIQASFDEVHLAPDAQLAVYRLVQESLTNIGKYAHAKSVRVRLSEAGGQVLIEVDDDGDGFDPAQIESGRHGLAGMRFRMASLGGTLTIDSTPGHGARLRAELPTGPHTDALAVSDAPPAAD